MLYKYKAVSNNGMISEGNYEAQEYKEVEEMLKSNGLIPLEISECIVRKDIRDYLVKKVTKKDLYVFCRQFYTMLNAGVSIIRCLEIMSEQSENISLKKSCIAMIESIQRGSSLSQAMQAQNKIFPEFLIQMVVAGEVSGDLDSIFERMAVNYDKEYKISNKIKKIMIYPTVLCIATILVLIIMLMFVIPAFTNLFKDFHREIPFSTRIILKASEFLTDNFYFIIALILFGIIAIMALKKSGKTKTFFDRVKLNIPIAKKHYRTIITARFTRAMSTLLGSGIGILDALEISKNIVNNNVISESITESMEEIKKGNSISKSLEGVRVFPPMLISMIRIGEEAGSIDGILGKTADYYDEELDLAIQKLTGIAEPVMIIIMGIVVGFIAISIIKPMLEVYQLIQ